MTGNHQQVSPRMRSRRRFLPGVVVITTALVVTMLVQPQLIGLHQVTGPAHLVSFRAILAICLLIVVLVMVTWGYLRPRVRKIAAVSAGIVLCGLGWNIGVLIDRGWESQPLDSVADDQALVVLVWNTQGGGASAQEIAELIAEYDVDMAVLPETLGATATEAATLLTAQGHSFAADTTEAGPPVKPVPTSVLFSAKVGSYWRDDSVGTTPGLASGVWRPSDDSGPTLVAVHTISPVPGTMREWRMGFDWLEARCGPDVIMAGDFNSTVDHLPALRDLEADDPANGCSDAARENDTAAVGTWPTALPRWMGTQIDRVLTGDQWQAREFAVLPDDQAANSDHRPVLAILEQDQR